MHIDISTSLNLYTFQKKNDIDFVNLLPPQKELQNVEAIHKANTLKEKISCLGGQVEVNSLKIELLKEQFFLYKSFIKSNLQQVANKTFRKVVDNATDCGYDLLDLLEENELKNSIRHSTQKMQLLRSYSDALQGLTLNEIYPGALNIPQRHFAISSGPLGTTNVKDCVFFILKNKNSYMTFAAHIDRFTDVKSIEEAIEEFLKKHVDDPYEAFVIGGHLYEGCDTECYKQNVINANNLIIKLAASGYQIDECLWWVLDEKTPINIVYEPTTNKFFGAIPGKSLSSYSAKEIIIYLDDNNKNLLQYHVPYEDSPLRLNQNVQKKLVKLLDATGKINKDRILNMVFHELPSCLLFYKRLKAVTQAYSKALKNMYFSQKIQLEIEEKRFFELLQEKVHKEFYLY